MAFPMLSVLSLAALHVVGLPAPEPTPVAIALPIISDLPGLNSALAALSAGPQSNFAAGYTSLLSGIKPKATPTNNADAASRLAAVQSAYPSDLLGGGANLVMQGMTGGKAFSVGNPATDVADFGTCNSDANHNYVPPRDTIYPKRSASDAPYDVSEASLRAAIYIPSTFKYGAVEPVLFIPGTGVEACESFAPNIGKLFANTNYADPVYVNVPGNLLADVQTNAEYVAYAVNYINGITGKNVSVITWSAGSITTQWALKYWPSTRRSVSDFVAVSPDYHGTIEVPLICPPGVPCAPSVLQQLYTSNFIQTLRNNGGDSAYVPTTNVYSFFDEVVEPQQDPNASGSLNDARGVGVTNEEIQTTCPAGTPAGGPNFGHESSLYNAVTVALAKDALQNKGPGNVARSGASSQCQNFFANGLTLSDVFATEFDIPLAAFNIETYPNKILVEPPIKSYAAADQP
ncbi:MAG: hypothetical protein M1828_007400 [Chrysothrix sp. TS-e1954]|nr:MAG: hypothetical protein M1828_007400 [Chrysothrix sp. TS-e1954]